MFSKFRQLSIYRLSRDVTLDPEGMNTLFTTSAFSPCSSQEMARTGFVNPLLPNEDGQLVYAASGFAVALIKREVRAVPSDVLKTTLAARVEKLQDEQGRKLKKTEKDAIKDEVLHSLLPRAFSRFSTTAVLFDLKGGRIFVNAGAKGAENALALVRKALGSLPVVPLTMETPVELTMTEWVKTGALPAGFAIGDRAQLKAILEDGGVINCNKQDLLCDEIANHLDAGKLVTKLGLDWQKRIQFVLGDSYDLTGIKFSDELQDQNDDIDREDVAQRVSADIILMASELVALSDALTAALGGEAER
ncbi:recombination-associated protein RdgC [Enterobacter soli]|uniref:recombination-associated protein RdgC n=1 Tax=Enterobacter soli TaxID=885040 RepID=UPI002F406CBB